MTWLSQKRYALYAIRRSPEMANPQAERKEVNGLTSGSIHVFSSELTRRSRFMGEVKGKKFFPCRRLFIFHVEVIAVPFKKEHQIIFKALK